MADPGLGLPIVTLPVGRPTIRQVADRAGVSTATVSRVLAGIGNPTPETVASVTRAVDDLGFRPSGIARSLRTRRTRTLGLIVTDIQNPFFPELVQAADSAARDLGYSIMMGSAAYDDRRAMHYLDLMVGQRVDGLIIASSQVSEEGWRWLLDAPVPVVVVNAEPAGSPVPVITSDNEGGIRLAVEHLVGLGHRRLAYIRGHERFSADAPRVTGFRMACADAGIAASELAEVRGTGQFEGGEIAMAELLASGTRVTAVICHNDVTAIGALRALRSHGRRVPHEVSVVGCDDIAAASWVTPALTTVAQQKSEMGRLAVERLAAALDVSDLDGRPRDPSARLSEVETIRLPMVLEVRDSTGPAPA